MADSVPAEKKKNPVVRALRWLKIKVVSILLIVWGFLKKGLTFIEDILTDINKKADVRVWGAIAGMVVIYKLALKVPLLITLGKTFDLIAYSVIISLLIGFVLALLGIARSSIDAGNDKSGPAPGIVDEIKTAISRFAEK